MVFSSPIFIFGFLPLVAGIYHLLRWRGAGVGVLNAWLAVASLVFVGWWSPWFPLLLLASSALDHQLGRVIAGVGADARRKNLALALAIFANAGLLIFFKHSLFVVESAEAVARWMGWGAVAMPDFIRNIVLPAGLSFHVLRGMSYCIDIHRGCAAPSRSLAEFVCFRSLFAHWLAGPITRHSEVAEQLRARDQGVEDFTLGLTRFSIGLAKKVLLADPLGVIVDGAFGAGAGTLSTFSAWFGAAAFALQIYFDFSGYADMALGLARLFGFRLPENFDSPYRAGSITEFWQRWHITLSSFLRDYLLFPLRGGRGGAARPVASLMFVALVGGLWHGASWTLVVWGALHGVLLCGERLLGRIAFFSSLPRVLRVLMTFTILLVTWVFYRAANVSEALAYLAIMAGQGPPLVPASVLLQTESQGNFSLLHFIAGAAIIWLVPNTQTLLARLTHSKALLGLLLFTLAVALMLARGPGPFLFSRF